MDKIKKIAIGAVSGILIALLAVNYIFDGYTFLMGRVRKSCEFDGAYVYEEDGTTVTYIFDDDEMVMYVTTETESTRVSYTYSGMYYNKGLFNRFLDYDDNWIKIPDADTAGQFHATCKTYVYSDGWGNFQYISEEEMEAIDLEGDGFSASMTYYFKTQDDTLWLITDAGENSFSVPLKKTNVISGDLGDSIEHLDTLWDYQFGE